MIERSLAAIAAIAIPLAFASCGGGGGSTGTPTVPVPVPTTTTNPAPGPQSADACPTSGASVAIARASMQGEARRIAASADRGARYVPGMVVYTDNRGGTRVESVDPARVAGEVARLHAVAGVRNVQLAQYRRSLSVTPNDPYYDGFGPGAPYYESSTQPGQWDMHVMGVSAAWSSVENGAPIAIVDTGVDVTHPDLSGKVVYARCFVTYPTSAAQTTGSYVTDMDGHGTDVAGIASADTNNAFGFSGAGFNAPLLAYRIFPTPPSSGCTSSSKNPQCDTTDVDEASAINDAVAHGAHVINLSLGAPGPLSNCTDTLEENAVENAISHGVVVVAASGNESANHLDCPAAYPGVIAVGASALKGSGNAVSEGVASYSNWVAAAGPGAGGAYLVAPGGDPAGSSDADDLHWIENIYSSTAIGGTDCALDQAGQSGDCRVLIAGTSQATPHVAGVAALMLGLRPNLTPAQIAADLCATATKIGGSKQGCGRLNAAAAVARAASQ